MTKHIILYRKTLGKVACEGIAEHSKVGITAVLNDNIPKSETCIRWGTTSTLPGNPKVFNRARAIHTSTDKGQFRSHLSGLGLAPKTWRSSTDFIEAVKGGKTVGPWVIRQTPHQRSEGLYLAKTAGEALAIIQNLPEWYISDLIKKIAEFRVFVCQGRVVWVVEKVPRDRSSVSWGCVDEGQFKYVAWSDWPLAVLKNAVESMSHTGLDFGAVDIMVGEDGKAYCAEINTGPQLTPYYIKRTANAFDYMVEGNVPEKNDQKVWKDFIHPAISENV